jgi:sugar phosphate isomerase/epimerase
MSDEDRAGWTRREALAAGLAAAGAWAWSGRARADEPGEYGPFRMGIQSYSLRNFGFEEALDRTKDLGLKYWESYSAHIPPDADKAAEHARKAAMRGVGVVGFGVVHFGKDLDAGRKLFEFGKALGIRYFSADPDPDAFDTLDRLVEEYGIAVGIHNHGPGHRYDTIEVIQGAIKGHHEKIGCCIDTGHFLRSKVDPVEAVEAFDKRIFGVHLKDVKDATTFTVLGQGDLKTAALLKALADRDYKYCLALEYEEHPEDPIGEIRECLEAARKAIPKG